MAKQKVFIEAIGLVEGHFSGIGQYILGILRGLDEIIEREKLAGNVVPEVEVIIPMGSLDRFRSFGFKNLRPKRFPLSLRFMAHLWSSGKMPPIDLYCGRGYYIFTRFVTMPLAFSKSAVVIYDLSFEFHPEYSDDGNANFLKQSTRRSLKQVDTVFTISKNARKEIHELYKVPNSMLVEATPAADQRYLYRRTPAEIAKAKEKYGIRKKYILALSNLEPRKNLETLIDAYCALPEKYRHEYSLLLVGVSGWKVDRLFNKIIALVQDGFDIIRPSKYVTDQDKAAIISGAAMLVYPSHYEGFGMPPLEALACGTPIITSDNSSLPEVVGSVGAMLHHHDTHSFTKTMKDYLDNLEKVTANSVVEGPKQAEKFSWQKSAESYWKVIQERTQ